MSDLDDHPEDDQKPSHWWTIGGIALGIALGIAVVCLLIFVIATGFDAPAGGAA